MAEGALKKLEEQLNCSICLDTYIDPKLLQCFHVYCRQCLVPLVVRDQRGQLGIACPTCRQVTPVPAGGVAGLPPAFHINRLLDIQNSASNGVVGLCLKHADEELKLYCKTCRELICLKCAIKGGGHQSHHYKDLNQTFEKCKQEITSSLEPLQKQVTALKKALVELDEHCAAISEQRETIENDVHVAFTQLREVLNVRETELISQLHRITQGKLKGLAAQKDQIETTLAQLNSHLQVVGESLETGNKGYVLMTKENTVKQVKEFATPFQPEALEPDAVADIVFSRSENFTSLCQHYGQILAVDSPNPLKCLAAGKGLKGAMVGEKSVFALSCEGRQSIRTMECELVSMVTGTRASCDVERKGKSQYEISYQPIIKGRHQLHVKLEGQHIKGSPFSVAVKAPIRSLGIPLLTIGGVIGPVGIAISQTGHVVVSDVGRGCISMLSSSGKNIRSFGLYGNREGECLNPHGIAIDGQGHILVADSGNHRIQKFTAEGKFIVAVGTKGNGPLQFSYPSDVTFHSQSNRVYVVDNGNQRIQVLNSNFSFYHSFGQKGSSNGKFQEPYGIACDSTGKVYVTDSGNHRIQVFTAEGKYVRMFGRRGQGRGELDLPYYIASDSIGMVYVSEWGNHRVSVFTSEGRFVTLFGRKGKGPGEFRWPCGLAVENSGVVYVCDGENNRIQVL